jgi:hypothetical protein
MPASPTFPVTPNPTVQAPSNDIVNLRVKVDRSRCKTTDPEIERRLVLLEKNGLSISIAQLVANANLHFAGSVEDDGEGLEVAQMREAWNVLRHWQMKAVPHRSRRRGKVLRVGKQENSRRTAERSEVLAVGVSLEIGIRIYDIAYPFWSATAGLKSHDLAAKDDAGNEIKVEARGRINRTNVKTAVKQVHKKFKSADFSKAAGVIFFPRTTNGGREDIMVLDPEGDAQRSPANSRYRNLLLHYVPFFIAQGGSVVRFGRRLKEISRSSEEEFAAYLERGDPTLSRPTVRRGRSGYNWNGIRYIGTFFEDLVWPEWLTGMETPSRGGVFFWGLAVEVINRFEDGHVESLRFTTDPATVKREETVISIEMPDLTLLIWGAAREDLDRAEDLEESLSAERSSSRAKNPVTEKAKAKKKPL